VGRIKGDLLERTFDFAIAVIELSDLLPQSTEGWVLGKQLLRSGTSVGANIHEADAARTTREFVSICNIAQRECAEATYWLRLCRRAELLSGDHVERAIDEAGELRRIICSICLKSTPST